MATLCTAIASTAQRLEALFGGTFTSVTSASVMADSLLPTYGFSGSDAIGGTLICQKTANASGSPAGQSRVVSDFSAAGAFTLASGFSASPAVGDTYGLVPMRYPRGVIVDKINEALSFVGRVPTENTSASSAANVTDYTYPASVLRDVRAVYVAQNATSPFAWQVSTRCQVDRAGGFIHFLEAPSAGMPIRVVYMGVPAYLSDDADVISDYIAMDWLAIKAALACATWRFQRGGADSAAFTTLINDLMQREQVSRRHALAPMPAMPTFPTAANAQAHT